MTDISPETVARYKTTGYDAGVEPAHDGKLVWFADYEALAARLAEWQASQHYSYIGRDGKPVLARDLEDRLIAAEAEVARLKTAQGAAGVLLAMLDGGDEGPISVFLRALAQGEQT